MSAGLTNSGAEAGQAHPAPVGGRLTIALVGSPNAGKTSLFNRLTGLRARTANFPGTTVEHRRGHLRLAGREASLVDLPGLYGLEATTAEQRVARQALEGQIPGTPLPDVTVVVLDATNLQRNLFLAGQVVELGRPTVIALNMIDEARRQKLQFDVGVLSEQLGCPVAPVSARTGEGFDALVSTLERVARERVAPAISAELRTCTSCAGCHYAARHDWAERVSRSAIRGDTAAGGRRTEAIDRVLTHRVFGLVCFAAVMLLTFMLIFWIAQYPMDLIDGLFALAGCTLGKWLPAGEFNSLLSNGVVGGVGGLLVFLPQICILFFLLSLLEDSGYLARAALVMDRLMHRVGLPGKAFVPLLSAHACAIPAIMSSRVIEDRRDRLATIMVIPLMTCSARVPVYAMVMSLLFPHQPFKASLLFAGAYALGIVAALVMAFCFRRTLLKGSARPLVIELPNYRWPSLRNALCVTLDRAWVFIKNAGTVILLISLALWALASYPKVSGDQDPGRLTTMDSADTLERARQLEQLEHSYAGRLGRAVQPVFAPLGFDWKTSVGVISSFAAREVIVSTLAVLYGLGDDAAESGTDSLYDALRTSRHPDGTPVFTTAACLSLLVFFVLAMQCLPTQAITRRETGSWRWALLQLGYMTLLAYTAALVTYQSAVLLS